MRGLGWRARGVFRVPAAVDRPGRSGLVAVPGPGGFAGCVRVEGGCLAAGLLDEVVQGGGGRGSGAPADPAFAAEQVVSAVEGFDQAGEAGRDGVVGEEGDADPVGGQGGQGGGGPALEFDRWLESVPVAGVFDGGAGEAVAGRGQQQRLSFELGDGDGGLPGPRVCGPDQGDDAGLVDQEAVGGSSLIRARLGVPMHGEQQLESELSVLFEADLSALVAGHQAVLYLVRNPAMAGVFRPVDDHARWTLTTRSWCTAARAAAHVLGIPLAAHQITDPGWASLWGLGRAGAALVRPDGHVGWRTRGDTPATPGQAEQILRTLLDLPGR